MNTKGIRILQIRESPREAINLLSGVLKQNGVTIYARIDQQDEARKGGLQILPLEFLLFGNPAKGGAIMADNPLAALDLPLKVIAWQNEQRQNFIAFNDIGYLASRYGIRATNARLIDLEPLISKLFK